MKKYYMFFSFVFIFCIFCISSVSAATITGIVKYDGDAPKFKEIKMDADPICLTHHNNPVYPQVLLLGDDNSMGNVFIHIVSGLSGKKYSPPSEPAILDQKGCMYEPHVLGVMVGQTLKVLNPDGTLHNVHGTPKENQEFNIAMPKFRKEITRTFDKPEFMFPMKCDVHPWMGAWVSVMEHPFFSVTKDDGKFRIEDLPAGEYEIEAWHEKLGTKKATIVVAEGDTKEVNFLFSKP
ncbi:MAG: hypothetical protein KC684_00565 [Candidatus Omnitrophica bacterium]|nr:hypothetical protein [Candidatus Omnitrophota bacterium]MCA9407099.1 hypothetical protein [Candidatus Omnitrophota bacterium]